ncbi:hypothetical protein B9Z55_024492 [Caenorhabditis nigoni]|uniref:Protein kinase domain-containing protein n=1 Tax=Caenorhabditis nigoni TaxID=1611254 RepID=A0A2G5SV11_9PELO|nr:hypothetical protein B9Z55_024492 [Caenorhabditis nigoni]
MYRAIHTPHQGAVLYSRYQVLGRLAVGSHSTIFRVEDVKNSNAVRAMKMTRLMDGDQQSHEMEIKALSKCAGSSNFPQVIDHFVSKSYRIIVMTLEGEKIRDVLGRNLVKSFSNQNTLRIARQLTNALHYLHTNGFLHRTVNDENVLIKKTGQHLVVTLCDLNHVTPTESRQKLESPGYYASLHAALGEKFEERDDMVSAMYLVGECSGFIIFDFIVNDLLEAKKKFHYNPCSFFPAQKKWIGRLVQLIDRMGEGKKIDMDSLDRQYQKAIEGVSPYRPIVFKTIKNVVYVE